MLLLLVANDIDGHTVRWMADVAKVVLKRERNPIKRVKISHCDLGSQLKCTKTNELKSNKEENKFNLPAMKEKGKIYYFVSYNSSGGQMSWKTISSRLLETSGL